jgi:hypothetical protein
MSEEVTAVETAEAILVGDDRLVKVIIKIRDKIAEVNKEYDGILNNLKQQKKEVEIEILRRLQERGATQTKTQHGTCFIAEKTTLTIADEDVYGAFTQTQPDPFSFYQKRAKVEHVQEWMKNNGGQLPPGLNSFRELEINTRVPKRKKSNGTDEQPEPDED